MKVTFDTARKLAQTVADTLQHNDVHWLWFAEALVKTAGYDVIHEGTHAQLLTDIDDFDETIKDLNRTIDKQDRLIEDRDKTIEDLEARLEDSYYSLSSAPLTYNDC